VITLRNQHKLKVYFQSTVQLFLKMSTDLFNSDLSNRFVCTVDAPFYDHDNPYTIRLLLTLQDLWTIPYESIKTEHF